MISLLTASECPRKQSAEAIKELQNELIILMEELKAVSTRNEELLAERDEDAETIQRLEADTADYKRKWETTRTQLRNLKGERAPDTLQSKQQFDFVSLQRRRPCLFRNRSPMTICQPLLTAMSRTFT